VWYNNLAALTWQSLKPNFNCKNVTIVNWLIKDALNLLFVSYSWARGEYLPYDISYGYLIPKSFLYHLFDTGILNFHELIQPNDKPLHGM